VTLSPATPSGGLRRPLAGEEHEPTLGQEEEETCPLGLEADEAAEPRARELEAQRPGPRAVHLGNDPGLRRGGVGGWGDEHGQHAETGVHERIAPAAHPAERDAELELDGVDEGGARGERPHERTRVFAVPRGEELDQVLAIGGAG